MAVVQYTFTHKQYTHLHTNNTQNNTMKQNTQNGTYITVRIHKYNNSIKVKVSHKRPRWPKGFGVF